jgi:predicted nucleotidyltransferase
MIPFDFRQIASYFQTKPVLKAYIFGSYARDEATSTSDLDILVELDYEHNGADFDNWMQMKEDLSKIAGMKIDLVSVGGLSNYFASTINQEKRLFYEKKME